MIANPSKRLTEERDIRRYESFPTFYLVVSGKKRNFAVKLDVELNEWRMKQVEERYISLLIDFGLKRIRNGNEQGFAHLLPQQLV